MIATELNPKHSKLNSLQVSLLKLFSQDMSDDQSMDIRKILLEYFDKELKDELEIVTKEKEYTVKDYREMLDSKS
ncbi:hypothetical protein MCERE19_02456 [Spirosomataceae bacterium]|jgi:hypothetical protein